MIRDTFKKNQLKLFFFLINKKTKKMNMKIKEIGIKYINL